ncbi:MAG TPA: outer membrane beta-barrel protein [Gammaproteobacteria bacterium]|nr:outer membrane beta-barrel protein [Gammaproteobacteria bacterium]
MFKKLLIVSMVISASSSIAFAGQAYKGEKDYKGEMAATPCSTFMAGPYIGLSIGDRTNFTGSPLVFKGLDGNLSLGYGALVSPSFYLAGEVFGIGTASIKDFTTSMSVSKNVSAKSSWGYGLSILPGYMLTDTVLGYIRGGVLRTRFNGTSVDTNGTGWQIGLGGQTSLASNWDIRAEYIYSYYGTISNAGKLSSDQANVGLVYKFL